MAILWLLETSASINGHYSTNLQILKNQSEILTLKSKSRFLATNLNRTHNELFTMFKTNCLNY